MKYLQLILFFTGITTLSLFAQPSNDECANLIDLGVAPICSTTDVFSNLGATTSNTGGTPSCFVSGGTQRDVWFAFTTATDIETYFITVTGAPNGTSGQAMSNPQLTFYRGSCGSLSEIGCVSAENGESSVTFSIANLPAGQRFILRVNDYTASATPNAGDFNICIEERREFIMGESDFTDACRGTLFDTGGPDGDYSNGEDLTYTICPNQFNRCIILEFESFDFETNFDFLTIHAGEDTNAPVLARVSGSSTQANFPVQASSDCVTIRMQSDASSTQAGFELTWQCESALCFPTSEDRITNASQNLPYVASLSSCGVPGSFAQTACGSPLFLNGPEHVIRYVSPGDVCVSVEVSGAATGTGVMILDALPSNPNANCIISRESGEIPTVDLSEAGEYYIVVANPFGCTDFQIIIDEADCALNPSLRNALCNPLNGCIEEGGAPSLFIFQDGFQDIELVEGVNSGCWQTFGVEADFFWFTIQAQADGDFGFILESADEPSDIDFSVWGPFTSDNACREQDEIVRFIESNQPIRSSWAAGNGRTGIVNTHPIFRTPILDRFDCLGVNNPSAFGDDFVRTIDAEEGAVYVVLINDFGNAIESNSINVDWSPSDPEVLAAVPSEITSRDTSVCAGQSVQLGIDTPIEDITWSPAETLSCTTCPNPIATPEETTIYTAIVQGVCFSDTVQVEVQLFGLDLPDNLSVCLDEEIQLTAGGDFEDATYTWTAAAGVELSCTDCPNPIVRANTPGTFEINVRLDAPTCPAVDRVTLTVLPQSAPEFEVAEDTQICVGETVELGNDENDSNQTYFWTSVPEGFVSDLPNPSVTPEVTTTYFVNVRGGDCPITSMDSVRVEVFQIPDISIVSDTAICQGEILQLSFATAEDGVTYLWEGQDEIEDETDLNTTFEPQSSGTYTLTATRGGCEVEAEVNVEVTPISVDIVDASFTDTDTIFMCVGDIIELNTIANTPMGVLPEWSPSEGLSDTLGLQVFATPNTSIKYYAQASNMECLSIDSVMLIVDSLPVDLSIMPSDTMVCEGSIVLLTSETYEPALYPNIEFEWTPSESQQTGDSLFNMVLSMSRADTIIYERLTTNGACVSRDSSTIIVNPLPEIQIIADPDTICPGEMAMLSVELLNPEEVSIESYMWGPEGLVNPADQSSTTVFSAGVAYNVEVQSDKMCPGAASYFLESENPGILQFPSSPVICIGESITLNSIFSDNVTYIWTSTDPDFGQINDPTPTVSPTSTTTYTVEVASENCPPFTQSLTVEVIEPQTFTLTASDTNICRGESVELTATATGNGVFEWSTQQLRTGESSTITVSPTLDTEFSVIYRYGPPDDARCGEETQSIAITVNDVPQVSIEADNTQICPDGVVNLSAIVDNDINIVSYDWSPSQSVTPTDDASVEGVGPNTYTVQVMSDQMCVGNASITINSVRPIDLDLPANSVICLGESIRLNNTISDDATYIWTSTDPNFDQFNVPDPIVSPSENAIYTVTVASPNCPPITQSVEVQVIQPQTFSVNPTEALVCLGESIELSAVADGIGNFTWSTDQSDEGVSSSSIIVSPESAQEITVVYSYGGASNDQCGSSQDFIILDVVEGIGIDSMNVRLVGGEAITPDFVFAGDLLEINAFPEDVAGIQGIQWFANGEALAQTGLSIQDAENVFPEQVTYTVVITNEFGCESTASISINVRPSQIQFPNIFAPNSADVNMLNYDNQNGFFRPFFAGNIELRSFAVYNRWGQKVYEITEIPIVSNDNTWAWNGKMNNDGANLPPDTYIYSVIYDTPTEEEPVSVTGEITLLR